MIDATVVHTVMQPVSRNLATGRSKAMTTRLLAGLGAMGGVEMVSSCVGLASTDKREEKRGGKRSRVGRWK